jgi:ArsR family transcriptional regulator
MTTVAVQRTRNNGRSTSSDSDGARTGRVERRSEAALLPPEAVDGAARQLRVLGHPARLRILEALAMGPSSVTELAGLLAIEPYAASKHLAELLKAGLVRRSQDGNFAAYSLPGPEALKAAALVCRAVVRDRARLAALAACHGADPPGA